MAAGHLLLRQVLMAQKNTAANTGAENLSEIKQFETQWHQARYRPGSQQKIFNMYIHIVYIVYVIRLKNYVLYFV